MMDFILKLAMVVFLFVGVSVETGPITALVLMGILLEMYGRVERDVPESESL